MGKEPRSDFRRSGIARASLMAAVLLIALAGCAQGAKQPFEGITEGSQARDFTLESLEGAQTSLSDFRGRVVVVNFWATWCPPCKAEIPDLETAYQAYQDRGVVVLGVNVEDPRQTVEPFVREMGMSYPVLLDELGQVVKAYRASGLPMTVVIDQQGVIRKRHLGFLTGSQLEQYLGEVMAE